MEQQQAAVAGTRGWTDGRLPEIRGTHQWVIALLVIMNLGLSVSLLVASGYGLHVIARLGVKPPLVYVPGLAGTARIDGATLLHTGPDDIELQGAAWDAVRFVAGADSTNAFTYFQQAKQLMTPDCRRAFEREVEPSAKELVDLKIYRVLEAQAVKPLQSADGPGESDNHGNRFELLVSGTLRTYRLGGTELLTNGPVSYRVQMVPTMRSVTNTRGVLVHRIIPVTETAGGSHAAKN